MMTPTREEMLRDNEMQQVEGFHTSEGPKKYMSPEDKAEVHDQIDIRMQELEDSGLTREELLYDQVRGFPLADDPFFQMVKTNKNIREMLIKPNEAFTADRVIEHALR
jgi:hypothetical protein